MKRMRGGKVDVGIGTSVHPSLPPKIIEQQLTLPVKEP
jgi:hypothetical protein